MTLIALAADNFVLHTRCLRCIGLNGDDPAGALFVGISLESVLVAMELEEELVWTGVLGDFGNLSLDQSMLAKVMIEVECYAKTYQIDNTQRRRFVLGAFGEVQETLSSLGRPSSIGMSNFRFLGAQVSSKMLRLESLITEPEECLLETQAPVEDITGEYTIQLERIWTKNLLDETRGLVT